MDGGGDRWRPPAYDCGVPHPIAPEADAVYGRDIFVGRSLDQLHAQRYGQEMPLPSLQLDIGPDTGGGGTGYHPLYAHRLSWASPSEPLPAIRSPRTAFNRIFGQGHSPDGPSRSQGNTAEHTRPDRDSDGEVARLRIALGAVDRAAMDKFLSDVRELERRIELVEARSSSGEERALPEAPAAVPDSWMEHMESMFDLQVLALESNITRVITFKTGRDLTNRIFPGSGVFKSFHATSHHANIPDTIHDYNQIDTYRLSAQRYLMEKLRDDDRGRRSPPDSHKTAIDMGLGHGGSLNVHSFLQFLSQLTASESARGALEGNIHLRPARRDPGQRVL